MQHYPHPRPEGLSVSGWTSRCVTHARQGNVAAIAAALAASHVSAANLSVCNEEGTTALTAACNSCVQSVHRPPPAVMQRMVSYLLSRGVHVNALSQGGRTALMHAARTGTLDVVQSLLEAGADVCLHDTVDYSSALHYAARRTRACVVNEEPEISNTTHTRDTHVAITQALIGAGADAGAVDVHGRSPLHVAAHHHLLSLTVWLVDSAGVEVSAVDNAGFTPLDWAVVASDSIRGTTNYAEVCEALIARGSPIESARWPLVHLPGLQSGEVGSYIHAARTAAWNRRFPAVRAMQHAHDLVHDPAHRRRFVTTTLRMI